MRVLLGWHLIDCSRGQWNGSKYNFKSCFGRVDSGETGSLDNEETCRGVHLVRQGKSTSLDA